MLEFNKIKKLKQAPKKIVSLVPSITELLFHLGFDEEIKLITKFCIYPNDKVKNIDKLQGPKKLDFTKIDEVSPDIIIAVKEENNKEDIIKLAQKYTVLVLDIFDFDSALAGISAVGKYCFKQNEANKLVNEIKNAFGKLNILEKKTCAYFIWHKPIMVAGANTFINSMLNKAGFSNVFNYKNSYPETNIEELKTLNPEYILLSSEPFKFTEKHKKIYQKLLPNAKILLVDGEMFSWYGSRMLYASEYFKQFIKKTK